MENTNVVKPDVIDATPDSEVLKTQTAEQAKKEELPVPNKAGDKTDPNLLLKSLQEEREKRREAERRAAEQEGRITELETQLNSSAPSHSDEVFSDEGKVLDKKIVSLNSQIAKLQEEKELDKVFTQFPDIRELSSEFEEFRKDYPRHKLVNVAKIFRAEKGLMDKPRPGLENPTGGPKTPVSYGMTADDAANLMKTDFKKYQKLIKEGKLKIVKA